MAGSGGRNTRTVVAVEGGGGGSGGVAEIRGGAARRKRLCGSGRQAGEVQRRRQRVWQAGTRRQAGAWRGVRQCERRRRPTERVAPGPRACNSGRARHACSHHVVMKVAEPCQRLPPRPQSFHVRRVPACRPGARGALKPRPARRPPSMVARWQLGREVQRW